jgi:predicted nucleic acid-binding protein
MDLVLLDTDVFSFFHRRDTRATLYEPDVIGKVRCLSFASVAELRFGALLAGWGTSRRQGLEEAVARTVIPSGDESVTRHWAQIKAARQRSGRASARKTAGSRPPPSGIGCRS